MKMLTCGFVLTGVASLLVSGYLATDYFDGCAGFQSFIMSVIFGVIGVVMIAIAISIF